MMMQPQEPTFEQRYNELAQIVTNTAWSANERIMYATLRIQAHKRTPASTKIGSYALFDDLTEDKAAALAGVSKSTAGDTLRKFAAVGLVQRKVERETVNRFGAEIPRESMDQAAGDHWQASTQTAIPLALPPQLPPLPEAPHVKKARQHSAQFRKVAKELMEMECPECHAIGKWHLVCGECGTTWTADELANLETPTGETFTSHKSEGAPAGETFTYDQGAQDMAGETFTSHNEAGQNLPYSAPIGQNLPYATDALSCATPALVLPDPPPMTDIDCEVLTGAQTIEYLSDLGASLTMVEPKGKKALAPVDDDGYPLGSWVDHPSTKAAVLAHLRNGGNAGMLPGRECLYWLDVDDGLSDLLAKYPTLATLPRVNRVDAPERGKLLIVLTQDNIRGHTYQGSKYKLELLGAGSHAVVAGTHASGATLQFTTGTLQEFSFDAIEFMAREWTGTTNKVTPIVARALQARPQRGLVPVAIHWWNTNPSNQAEVDRLLATCPHRGKYSAIRADDRTPSTLADHDAYSQQVKRTWFDYGARRKLDDFEMFCELTGEVKSSLIWDVVQEYKQARNL